MGRRNATTTKKGEESQMQLGKWKTFPDSGSFVEEKEKKTLQAAKKKVSQKKK